MRVPGSGHWVWAALVAGAAFAAVSGGMLLEGSARASGVPRTPAPEGVSLYLISPQEGATVASPVAVRFGLKGMGVAPAGVRNPKTGHHHLILDADLPPLGLPIPADANHRHFGGGQTEVSLELAPGSHTLQLLLGDHDHVPFEPAITSDRITIQVK